MNRMTIFCALAGTLLAGRVCAQETARGIVFHDLDGDRQFDEGEPPLPGVRVSNGVEIVATAPDGSYELPVDNDTTIFVIKPRGWRTPISDKMLPQFYYTHKPEGSPPSRYPGVAPTGPLPDSIDFPLYPQEEPNRFRAVLFADTQPRNMKEIDYITRDVIEELIGVDAAFGVTLGDILFDDLTLFDPLIDRVALIGIPWYNIVGNHDLNFDAKVDELSDETYERYFGPNYYSFDYGPVHFIVMDTVNWFYDEGEGKGRYRGGIDEAQLTFIENDLAGVPENKLLVLMMHIPLTTSQMSAAEREKLFSLIDDRPFTLSIAGHAHYQEHVFVGEEHGWQGPQRHHHVINVTVSGSWWSGAPDELGIPHTTMRDGAPNGYSIITFDGSDYSLEFKAARRPADYQMNIYLPESVPSAQTGETDVVVNVFAGTSHSTVEVALNGGEWIPMEQYVGKDPFFLELKEAEGRETPPQGRKLPDARDTSHLWRAKLPADLPAGAHTVTVRTTDMFRQTYEDHRILIVD